MTVTMSVRRKLKYSGVTMAYGSAAVRQKGVQMGLFSSHIGRDGALGPIFEILLGPEI